MTKVRTPGDKIPVQLSRWADSYELNKTELWNELGSLYFQAEFQEWEERLFRIRTSPSYQFRKGPTVTQIKSYLKTHRRAFVNNTQQVNVVESEIAITALLVHRLAVHCLRDGGMLSGKYPKSRKKSRLAKVCDMMIGLASMVRHQLAPTKIGKLPLARQVIPELNDQRFIQSRMNMIPYARPAPSPALDEEESPAENTMPGVFPEGPKSQEQETRHGAMLIEDDGVPDTAESTTSTDPIATSHVQFGPRPLSASPSALPKLADHARKTAIRELEDAIDGLCRYIRLRDRELEDASEIASDFIVARSDLEEILENAIGRTATALLDAFKAADDQYMQEWKVALLNAQIDNAREALEKLKAQLAGLKGERGV